MPYKLSAITGGVNCYLLQTSSGFVLIDTGFSFSRGKLKTLLADAGCRPGDLKLVIITHADADHTGSCLYLRKKYGVKIAMHQAEAPAAVAASMTDNRKTKVSGFGGFLMGTVGRLMAKPFQPDLFLSDGDDLSPYGLDAKVVYTPGHTVGSISIFTADGDLFCGDFLNSVKTPRINRLTDDMEEMKASLEKIKKLPVKRIYPGHGEPFFLEELLKNVE
jgi:hydroxyacylglutathione hydrolase